ncbi:hypothetical protein [Streptomyces sp. AC627_RSS907]|uniref:hypothetical protein n=1 Tax=Streptomyces sp. AC627_RSS907 TaxID=2823684 RepID=UPI001C22BE92|nr:hypothetical protein [Streptomyces sp. AC627_RSS907]
MDGTTVADRHPLPGLRTGDRVTVTRVLTDGRELAFRGTLDLSGPHGGFTVTGEDLTTGLRTTGHFLAEDAAYGVRQRVEKYPLADGTEPEPAAV